MWKMTASFVCQWTNKRESKRICHQRPHHTTSCNVKGFQETPGLIYEVSEVQMVGLTIGTLPTVELPEVTFASIQFGTEVNSESSM